MKWEQQHIGERKQQETQNVHFTVEKNLLRFPSLFQFCTFYDIFFKKNSLKLSLLESSSCYTHSFYPLFSSIIAFSLFFSFFFLHKA